MSSQTELLRAHRLTNLGSLAAFLVHDLNNLFTGLYSLHTLLQTQQRAEKRKEYFEEMQRSLDEGAKLLRALLAYVKEEHPERLTPDPIHQLQQTISLTRRLLPATCAFETLLPIDSYAVAIPPSHLSQIVLNLLINAKEALPAQQGKIELTARYSNRSLLIEISDNGPGIPAPLLPKLFKPFFSTKKHPGLGLAIVQQLVSQAEGTVTVQSLPNQKTSFIVSLPINSSDSKNN